MALINKLTAIADSIREKTGKADVLTLDQMPLEIAGIQAGVELNFNVVGGTSVPSNPSENMIWINTDVEITNWAFVVSEPEMPSNGMVWFPIGTTSMTEFNALTNNQIQIYSILVKQYINGTWTIMSAQTYRNGAWIDWGVGVLYYSGNQYESFTGGWKARAWIYNEGCTAKKPTVSFKTDKMVAYVSGSTYLTGVLETKNDIDLSDYSKIYIDWEGSSTDALSDNPTIELAVADRDAETIDEGIIARTHLLCEGETLSRRISELSIAKINDSYSIHVNLYSVTGKTQITIYKIWME